MDWACGRGLKQNMNKRVSQHSPIIIWEFLQSRGTVMGDAKNQDYGILGSLCPYESHTQPHTLGPKT